MAGALLSVAMRGRKPKRPFAVLLRRLLRMPEHLTPLQRAAMDRAISEPMCEASVVHASPVLSELSTGRSLHPSPLGASRSARSTMIYAGLFLSAFASATLLPGSSEAALLALLVMGQGDPALLMAVATAGNVLGSLANWLLGRYLFQMRDRPWFPVGPEAYDRAIGWFRRYGIWSLLLSWVPVIGDPLTLVAGFLRVRLLPFLLLVSTGKAGRYAAILAGSVWWKG